MRGKIKELLFIKFTLYSAFRFELNRNKAKYSIHEKLSRVFSVAGPHGGEIKPLTPVLVIIHFPAAVTNPFTL